MPSARAGDLEVHVAERVFLAQDVGQDGELAVLAGDQAHRRAGDRRLDRHAGIHQRERRAARRGHRRRAVGRDALADDADDVRELFLARQDRDQGALGERAVADLAPAGAAHGLVLAGRVGRHVVVVQVALGLVGADRVDALDVRRRAERGDRQRLGLAAREQRRAVGARQEADLDRDRPDGVQVAAVHADALVRGPARGRSSCAAGRTGSSRSARPCAPRRLGRRRACPARHCAGRGSRWRRSP